MATRIYPESFSLIPGMSTTHHGTGEHIPNKVRMSTSYCEGGISYFDYKKSAQGIRVSFGDVEAYDGRGVCEMMGSGVAFHVLDTARYNEKKVRKVHDTLAPHIDELANLWRTDREALRNRLNELVTGI